jgi:hypothetical protein
MMMRVDDLPTATALVANTTAPTCPAQAKCALCTINNILRLLLFQASLPPVYWVQALYTATYILNRHPTKTQGSSTLFSFYTTHTQPMHIYVCSVVHVTQTCHLQPHIKSHPDLHYVFFLSIPPIIKVTNVTTTSLIELSYHAMLCLMNSLFLHQDIYHTYVAFMLGFFWVMITLLLQHLALDSYLQDHQEASAD